MKNYTPLYFQEILDKKRQKLLPLLIFFTEKGFYLAGGTALALQYGHRESIDFDFFIPKDIDPSVLYEEIQQFFGEHELKKTHQEKNTLYIEIDGIKIICMSYFHKLLKNTINAQYLKIAQDIDIACMKLWAIQNRATNKDYIDMYYILQKFSLSDILDAFYEKFGEGIVSENYLRKSLIYFDDVVEEPLICKHKITWEEVKKYLEKIVLK